MSFEVQVLGSGAALPTMNRGASSQYVNCNERHILIDCGEGTQMQIRKFGIKLQKIKIILISHLHGDHFFGLMGLLGTMSLLGRTAELTIYAPPELDEIIQLQLKASGHYYEFKLIFVPLNQNEKSLIYEDRRIEIWTFPLKHRIPANGFLIREKNKDHHIIGEAFEKDKVSLMAIPFFKKGEDYIDEDGVLFSAENYSYPPTRNKSYAYCSDTAVMDENAVFLEGVDALYHEATFIDAHKDRAKKTLHSTAAQAAAFALKAKARKLYLGHLSSRYENGLEHEKEARSIFENTVVVEDGMKFHV